MPTLDPVNDPDFYDLVVVGRGYSASTYLFTADLSWCKKILIIGGPDAWDKIVRGDGIVNHANYIYARDNPGKTKFTPEDKPAQREALKDQNADILNTAIEWLGKGVVTDVKGVTKKIAKTPIILTDDITRPGSPTIKKGTAVNGYTISYDEWKGIPSDSLSKIEIKKADEKAKTLKVVYCGGAGPHKDDYSKGANFPSDTFLDLDSFMRDKEVKPSINKDKLIVIGPNAGVDAAVEALKRQFDLYWLISGKEGTKPAWLSTKHYSIENQPDFKVIDEANKCVINYNYRNADLAYDSTKKKYSMTLGKSEVFGEKAPKNGTKELEVDYLVYATGQNPHAEETFEFNSKKYPWRIGPAKVLEDIIKQGKLTPIYDINQRFGEWYETALGLKDQNHSKYSGLEVLGAAALALVNDRSSKNTEQAFFKSATTYTQSLDQSLQPEKNINDALKAIRTTTWYDDARIKQLYGYLENQDGIPTVATTMAAILPKLYSQTLVAADQLGTIKSQIEAITGFDLIAASSGTNKLVTDATNLRKALQEVKNQILEGQKKIEELRKNKDNSTPSLTQIKTAIEQYNTFRKAFNPDSIEVNDKVKTYIKLLSNKEQSALSEEGVKPGEFAKNINNAVSNVDWDIRWLSGNFLIKSFRDDALKSIPQAQKWLTNLEAIFQAPVTVDINSAINFNGADRTQLAVLLAAAYPSIPVTNWRPITTQIIEGRKVSPWGYNPDQVGKIKDWLKAMNEGEKSVNEFPSMS
jgi:hypothetical protein